MSSPRKKVEYVPLAKASKPWSICVSFPHMKDAYWMAVDYEVVEEATRLGVKMQLVEAGGYTELKKQISQIEDCVSAGSQAVVIGAISYNGLNNLISEPQEKDPGHRRHQRHLLHGSVREVAGVVRRDGCQGRRIAGQATSERQPASQSGLVPRTARCRVGGGR